MVIILVVMTWIALVIDAKAAPDPVCQALNWNDPIESAPYITVDGVVRGCAADNDQSMTIGIEVNGITYTAQNVEPLTMFSIAIPLSSPDAFYTYWAEDTARGVPATRSFQIAPGAPLLISR